MRIGVDLGGTKIEVAAFDAAGEVHTRRRVPTPAARGYDAIIESMVSLVCEVEREVGAPCTVGVGTPGARSPETGLWRNCNTTCLNGRALDRDMSAALGRDVKIANDADCFALSESVDGAGAGAQSVFGVIAGTGVGGGFVVAGALLGGPNACAGEWGHNPLPWPDAAELERAPTCYCGKRGCIETWLSGPALARDHFEQTGEALEARAIARRAARGEEAAQRTLCRHADRFARSLASVINVVDPHVIVLGGGLSNLPDLAGEVRRRWARYVFSDCVRTRLVRNLHGDSSGVRGAAWLHPIG